MTVVIAYGSRAWDGAPHLPGVGVVAPPGEDPSSFDWRWLRGHEPIMIRAVGEATEQDTHRLAVALLSQGVDRLLEIPSARMWRARA